MTPLQPSCVVLQSNAELAVRDMLRDFARRRRQNTGSLEVEAEDFMDDGTPIRLRVKINEKEVSRERKLALKENNFLRWKCDLMECNVSPQGSAVFDFTGTGTEVWGNCNAPRAITLSALIYCLRCMVGQDIPLNQVTCADLSV